MDFVFFLCLFIFDHTKDAGEIMRHFFDSKHIDEFIADVTLRYPEEMKESKGRDRKSINPGGRAAKRDADGKWGVSKNGLQNHLLQQFLMKIDDALLYR